MDIEVLSQEHFKEYPPLSRLLDLPQIPDEIYIRGKLPSITLDHLGRATPRILTVVGSREHSSYAREALEYLLQGLRGENVIVLSGLAIGIDSSAHKSALENNLLTIGIPGSGLHDDVLYPRSSERLAKDILYAHGTLLSEFSPSTKAAKWTFLARNRVMAALADAILVAEAKENSGTLVTARYALELGKPIGCITGSLFSEFNKGSNALIRDGATPLMSQEDLFSLLEIEKKKEETAELPLLSEDESHILSLLSEPHSKADLLLLSKLPPDRFLQALTMLELSNYVKTSLHEVRKLV